MAAENALMTCIIAGIPVVPETAHIPGATDGRRLRAGSSGGFLGDDTPWV